MIDAFKAGCLIVLGFGAGLVIAGAVFAFIAIIGVVPRLAQKTKTTQYIELYEEAIIWGGIFGTTTMLIDYYIPLGTGFVILFGLCIGVFYGSLAVSLAEVIDVIPILSRRCRIQQGMMYFIFAIALGKLIGSSLYYFVPGFFY